MAGNRGVAYIEPGKVEVQSIDYPELVLKDGPGVNPANVGRKLEHGVVLKVVTSNICGSDQHMVRGRTTAPPDLVLGHEILGEVVEKAATSSSSTSGPVLGAVQHRVRPVPELQGGQDRHLPERQPGPAGRGLRLRRHGRLGRWAGEYVTVPYADWNLLRFPDRDQAMEKVLDLTMLSDIFPTGFHGR